MEKSFHDLVHIESERLRDTGLSDEEILLIAEHRVKTGFHQTSEDRKRRSLPVMIGCALFAAVSVWLLMSAGESLSDASRMKLLVPSLLLPASLYAGFTLNISIRDTVTLLAVFILIPAISMLYPVAEPGHTALLSAYHLPVIYLYILIRVLGKYLEKSLDVPLQYTRAVETLGETVLFTLLAAAGWLVVVGILGTTVSLLGYNFDSSIENRLIPSGFGAMVTVSVFVTLHAPLRERNLASILSSVFIPVIDLLLLVLIIVSVLPRENPGDQRELLIMLDGILILVICLILFSPVTQKKTYRTIFDKLLVWAAVILDLVAMVSISFRLFNSGFTPNKSAAAVLNILFLIHLVIIGVTQMRKGMEEKSIQKAKTGFLFIYAIWAFQVVFFFPLLFGFR